MGESRSLLRSSAALGGVGFRKVAFFPDKRGEVRQEAFQQLFRAVEWAGLKTTPAGKPQNGAPLVAEVFSS